MKKSQKCFFERQKSKILFQPFIENFLINPKNPLIGPPGFVRKQALQSIYRLCVLQKRQLNFEKKIASLTLKIDVFLTL